MIVHDDVGGEAAAGDGGDGDGDSDGDGDGDEGGDDESSPESSPKLHVSQQYFFITWIIDALVHIPDCLYFSHLNLIRW